MSIALSKIFHVLCERNVNISFENFVFSGTDVTTYQIIFLLTLQCSQCAIQSD